MYRSIKVCFSLMASISICKAQDPIFGPYPTEREAVADNVSVASGYRQSLQSAPAVTSVITAEQIKNTGARDLYDVLRTVPGFFLAQNVSGIEPIIVVRGFWSSFNQNILILLDGVPQTNPLSGDRLAVLGLVPLDSIERIEIMRGPGSALYGADAYSAVIDIITHRTRPDATHLTLGGGSQQTYDARWLSGGRAGPFDMVGALEYKVSDGPAPLITADSQTRLDALFGTDASHAPGPANTNQRLFGALLNMTRDDMAFMLRTSLNRDLGMGVGLAGALDPDGAIDTNTFEGRFEWKTDQAPWKAMILLDHLFHQILLKNAHYFPPGASERFPEGLITQSDTQLHTTRLESVVEYTGWPTHHFSFGLGAETGRTKQNAESRNFTLSNDMLIPLGYVQAITDPDLLTFGARTFSHDLHFAYLQDAWNFNPDWVLTWGVRYDHYAALGGQINPRLALVWDTSPYLTTKLIYGRGFRAPSLVDTQSRQSPILTGNPDLKPERIESLELAFDYRMRYDLLTRLNLFYQKTDDQIRLLYPGGLTLAPTNAAQQIGHGLEWEVQWEIDPRTQFYGNYSYQNNEDQTTHTDSGYGPHHLLLARLQRHQTPWFFSLQARYVGRRARSFTDPRPRTEPYTVIDGLVRYEIAPDVEVQFDVRTVLDVDAVDDSPGTLLPSDLPVPGRTYYFTLFSRF